MNSVGDPPPWGASCNISCEFVKPAGVEGDSLDGVGEVIQLGEFISVWSEIFSHTAERLWLRLLASSVTSWPPCWPARVCERGLFRSNVWTRTACQT